MGSTGIYIRINKKLLEEFTKTAQLYGMSRSEAIRKSMEMFIQSSRRGRKKTMTSAMRGIVKSKLSLRELEEAYLVSK